jgi:prepilin-type N-terminal cleavage/methylation domain-containing protein
MTRRAGPRRQGRAAAAQRAEGERSAGPRRQGRAAADSGFSLIEVIAVVAIFALLMALVMPGVGRLSGRTLRAAADDLAAQLELARQRAVVTSIPHRVWIDLDQATYRVEWLVGDAEAAGEPDRAPAMELDLRGDGPLPLEAPRDTTRAFRPLPGLLGRDEVLEDPLAFRGVETLAGFADSGEATIEFAPDGSSDATSVVVDDESGNAFVVEVLPLAETIRVSHADE